MRNRTVEDIKAEFDVVTQIRNVTQLQALADEVSSVVTSQARALRLLILSEIDTIHGKYADALEKLQQMIDIHTERGDVDGIAQATGKIGSILWQQGDCNTALDVLQRALSMTTADEHKARRAALTSNIASVFTALADYSTGLEYQQRALAMYQEIGSLSGQARTLGNIAIIYSRIDDVKLALEYLHRALAIDIEIGNDAGRANIMGNIGIMHAQISEFDEAFRWLTEAIELARAVGLSREQGYYLTALAEIALLRGDVDLALEILDTNAAVIAENPSPTTSALLTRGTAAQKRGDVDEAMRIFHEALHQLEQRGERGNIANCHRLLRDLAKERGDFEAYIKHNELFQSLTEEIKGSLSTRRFTMQERDREIEEERRAREREREILYGALPQHVADRLIRGEEVADTFESASVMFLDLAGFTRIASMVPPGHVVHLLESIFSVCDEVIQRHGITKIKTIGDSYMAVAGVPVKQDDHVDRMARAATEIQGALETMQLKMPPELGDTSWVKEIDEVHARVGVHCGPVVAGVVGKERLQYDVWGDAVNVASRMESSGEPGHVQASEDFINALSDRTQWHIEPRVAFEIKGKGMMQTYWLASN